NGGCGDVEEYECTDGVGKEPRCVRFDECSSEDDDCVEPQKDYECYPNPDGTEPSCRFIGECILAEERLLPSIAATLETTGSGKTDILNIGAQGTGSGPPSGATPAEIYLRFDLKEVSEMQIDQVILQMTSYGGFAHGGNGMVFVNPIDNDW